MEKEVLKLIPYLIINEDNTIIGAGEKADDIFKTNAATLIDRNFVDFIKHAYIEDFKNLSSGNIFSEKNELELVNNRFIKLNIIHKGKSKLLLIEDITHLKKRELEHLKINSLLENIFNLSSEALRIIDSEFNIIKANKSYLNLHKLTDDDVIGEKCSNLLCFDICHSENCVFNRISRKENIIDQEVVWNYKDEKKYFILNAKPYEVNGEILGVVESLKDITSIKKASEEILKQKKHIELIINNIPPIISYINSQEEYVFVNQKYSIAFNVRQSDIIGKKVQQIHQIDYQIIKPHIIEVLSGKEVKYEAEFYIPANGKRWLSVTYIPDFDITFNVRGFFVFTHDITDFRITKHALEDSKEKYKLIANNTDDIIWTLDQNGKFLFISPSVEKIRGFTVEEALKHTLKDVLCPDSYEIAKKEFENTFYRISRGEKIIGTRKYILNQPHKNGSTVKMEISVNTVFDEKGKFKYIIGVSRDISSRVGVLNSTEQVDLANILRNFNFGYAVLEIRNNNEVCFIDVNSEFENIIQISKNQLINISWKDIFKNIDVSVLEENTKEIIEGKNLTIKYFYSPSKKHLDIYIFSPEKGKIAVFIRDITESVNYEAILEENEKKLNIIIENISDVIYSIDQNGKFSYMAGNLEQVLGYPVSKFIGNDMDTVSEFLMMPKSEIDKYYERINHVKKNKIENIYFDIKIRKNNKISFIENKARIVYDSDGQINKINGIFRDITSRKRNEERLSRLLLAVRQSPSSVVITDIDGYILFVNNKFCEITGYEKEEVLNKHSRILKSGIHNHEFYKNLWNTISSGKIWQGELTNVKKDGTLYFENAYIYPVKEGNGEIKSYIGMKEDITERKKIEEILQQDHQQLLETHLLLQQKTIEIDKQKDELLKLNATKDKFLSIIGHDLRNPIGSLYGFTKLLLSKYNTYDDEKRLYFINTISEASKSTLELIENLFTWARAHTGIIDFFPERIDIKDIIKEILTVLNSQAVAKNIKLICDIEDKCIASFDKNMISTVLRNLVSNSIKFTKKDGTVKILVKIIGNELFISIIDNGVGICDDDLNRLFEIDKPFSLPGTENENGTGLGLILCKEFIQKHNGVLTVKSKIGEGSNFSFTLPVNDVN